MSSQPQAPTVKSLDLSQSKVGDALADVGEHLVVRPGRSGILALGLVNDLVVVDKSEAVLGDPDYDVS